MQLLVDYRRVRCEHHAVHMQLLISAPWDSILTGGLHHARDFKPACDTASPPHAVAR
jgi:hypothetical protein